MMNIKIIQCEIAKIEQLDITRYFSGILRVSEVFESAKHRANCDIDT